MTRDQYHRVCCPGKFHAHQQKTEKQLRIGVSQELRVVINASRDDKLCSFIIHHRQRMSAKLPESRALLSSRA